MKITTLTSLFVLLSVVSMVAIAPSAFADHTEVTIEGVIGAGSDMECDVTDNCWSTGRAVSIAVGGEITFLNTDNVPHSLSSGTSTEGTDYWPVVLVMAPIDGNAQSQSFTLDSAGEYPFFCMVHPWMVGTITVEDEAAEAAEDQAAADAAAAEAAEAEAEAAAAAAITALEAEQAADAAAAEAADAAAAEAADAAAAEAAAMAAAAPREPAIDLVNTLNYNINGGSVSSIITNSDDATLVVAVDASDDGELSITMDSNYITAFDDDSYFVLVNNEEVWFSQDGSTLTIPFEAGTEKIEIVGSAVVPEFGTIAMVVLAVAIISIIVITAKTKTQLIPKL